MSSTDREALTSAAAKRYDAWKHKRVVPLTHRELDALAEDAVADLKASAEAQGGREDDADRTWFTCHHCCQAATCELVYDAYNTNGDCLASK